MKIIFFGTSNFVLPILERLVRHHEVAAVVTTPDAIVGRNKEITESPVCVLADEMELKVFKPESLRGNLQLTDELKKMQPDVFVVVSYGKLIPSDILNIPAYKSINIHPSLLPKYRGPSPIQYALLKGEVETGTTIMLMDETLDHGSILASEPCPIDRDDNFITLGQKLSYLSADLLMRVLPDYVSGKLTPLPQDEFQATFTKTISKQDGKIDWYITAQEIYNQFRAFYPWPGVWTTWNGINLKITDCKATNLQTRTNLQMTTDGAVLPDGIVVCGGGTFLQIKSLQLAGKKQTDIKSFLNGRKDFIGASLGR